MGQHGTIRSLQGATRMEPFRVGTCEGVCLVRWALASNVESLLRIRGVRGADLRTGACVQDAHPRSDRMSIIRRCLGGEGERISSLPRR